MRAQGIFISVIAGAEYTIPTLLRGLQFENLKKYLYSSQTIQTLRNLNKISVVYLKNMCSVVHHNIVYD